MARLKRRDHFDEVNSTLPPQANFKPVMHLVGLLASEESSMTDQNWDGKLSNTAQAINVIDEGIKQIDMQIVEDFQTSEARREIRP